MKKIHKCFNICNLMSDYIIKNYQEEFIEEQVAVGTEVLKDWKFFGQTSAERLKETYSAEDFDPETRIYCFKDEKMVGFLTAAVREVDGQKLGFLRFPYVLPEHEKVADLLFEKIEQVFKKKGISKLQGVAGEIWGSTVEQSKKWGFKEMGNSFSVYTLDVSSASVDAENQEDIVEFEHTRDVEKMIEIFMKEFGQSREAAELNFKTIKEYEGPFLAHYVVHKDDTIVARAFAFVADTDDPTTANQGNMYITDESYRQPLQAKLINSCKEAKIKTLQTYFNPQTQHLIEASEKLGFKCSVETKLFEKEI